ncbi:hypothetical protein HHI36_003828 [Cryptolaemus montrouzieri]|uniref:Uncharacterized protein n=1 Tax=Cryptolaemus montrouzieri TaxID=559131 RepID=A0ABD2NPB9_9CUCU
MDNFFQHFRSFLGLPIYDKHDYPLEDERNPDDFDSRYDAFSDPMEMHHYFEQQMNKILRNFDIFEFGKSDSFFGDFSGSGIEFFGQHSDQFPSLEDKSKGGELRDQFLKPGYERPTQKHLMDKSDKELDESKISIHDLDSVLTGKFFKDKQEQPKVTTRVFGRSISTKTVVNPDGSMEIHKTIRDNEGNEETTITKR